MSYTDLYADVISEVLDVTYLDPAFDANTRLIAQGAKLNMVENALQIASGPNPIVSMLDMTVMVGLQRRTWDSHWRGRLFDDEIDQRVAAALNRLDEEIWTIVAQALEEEQQAALRELIEQMCETYSDQRYVSGIRASEFAQERQKTFVSVKGGGSLLTLFALDPLANLSPATREIVESRLLAERVFFFGARLPELMRGQARVLGLEYAAMPESQQILQRVDETVASTERAVDLMERLPDRVAEEREAAIDQVFDRLAAERNAVFDRLESDEERLRGMLGELRAAIEAGSALSESIQPALVQGRELAEAIAVVKQPNPGSRPLDLRELESATVAATEAVRELNAALGSAQQLLADEAWLERETQLRQATSEIETGMRGLIDVAFWRAIVFAAAVGAIVVIALAVNRALAKRARTVPSADDRHG